MSHKEKITFKVLTVLIMVLIIVYLLNVNQFIFNPILEIIGAVFLPIIFTGIFYYLCRPLVQWLENRKIPTIVAILLLYSVIGSLLFIAIKTLGPIIHEQFVSFVDSVPAMIDFVIRWLESIQNQRSSIPSVVRDALPDLNEKLKTQLNQNTGYIADSIFGAFSWISNLLLAFGLVPFILFYALKDGKHFAHD